MSDHFITLIPTIPYFVPSAAALKEALRFFTSFIPKADQIEGRVTDEVTFVDQGQNFERVSCPSCYKELATAWWQEAMDKSYKSRFTNLGVVTPCCTFSTSLNDLDYHVPAGFARCLLQAKNPRQREVEPDQIRQLEGILGVGLRQIWTHY